MVGSNALLGNWHCVKGIKLLWSEGHLWRSKPIPISALSDDYFEYKFAVVDLKGNTKSWQEGFNSSFNLAKLQLTLKELEAARNIN